MADPRFRPGAEVRVLDLAPAGHNRTPSYVRGRRGRIEGLQGRFPNPERRAYGADGRPAVPLYLVSFRQSELWEGYGGPAGDSLVLDLFEHWLEPVEKSHGP